MTQTTNPKISAVVCTRNRGDRVAATINSLLANTHPSFEVILIDQSPNQETELAVQQFLHDPRFNYHHTTSVGTGVSRNLGVQIARGTVVAFTDDDCTVPTNWLETMATIFDQHPRVAVVFCNVEAVIYDTSKGFVPTYLRKSDEIVRTLRQKCKARGIGAGMAVRREAVMAYGNFDTLLGPGTRFPDCEDGDIAVRALLNNWWIYETAQVTVTHDGFRTWKQGKELSQRNWIGIGAAYSKPIKCRKWKFLIVVLYEAFAVALWAPLSLIWRFKKPVGLRRFFYFWKGFFQGMRAPIDCHYIRFIPTKPDGN